MYLFVFWFQLLGEEMYSSHEQDYSGKRRQNSEKSSRSVSPDVSRIDNINYEDSLDVAFEHNNKLRDKIQQRMRESENLLASSFGQRSLDAESFQQPSGKNDYSFEINGYEQQNSGMKNKISGGSSLDKAISNLLHHNSKHDQT